MVVRGICVGNVAMEACCGSVVAPGSGDVATFAEAGRCVDVSEAVRSTSSTLRAIAEFPVSYAGRCCVRVGFASGTVGYRGGNDVVLFRPSWEEGCIDDLVWQ